MQRRVLVGLAGLVVGVTPGLAGCLGFQESRSAPAPAVVAAAPRAGSPAAGVAGAAAAATATPSAEDSTSGEDTRSGEGTTPAGQPGRITLEQAGAAALQAVEGGHLLEVKLEDHDDAPSAWEVTLVTGQGQRRELTVDTVSGRVVRNVPDD